MTIRLHWLAFIGASEQQAGWLSYLADQQHVSVWIDYTDFALRHVERKEISDAAMALESNCSRRAARLSA